ncbi:MAG: thioredoxin family protein [Candidatus Bipolaricaulota bacterium]|nr:thioredoxin family protein [Candidatus Bipolaricaulota bacterium]
MIARVAVLLAIGMIAFAAVSQAASVAQDPVVVVFYREGCEDCLRMEPVLKDLEAQYPELGFRYIEWAGPDAALVWSLAAAYGVVPWQFPVIFVGKTALVGASRANELALRSAVEACASSACMSPLNLIHSSGIPWLTILLVGLAALVLVIVFLA